MNRRVQTGMSLIELLIATVVGLILVGGMITVFSGTRQSATINSTLTELQENARFAMDSIVRDTRMAGFQGCVDINTSSATVRANSSPTSNYFATAISSSQVTSAAAWDPAPPTGFTVPDVIGVPVAGTDTLSVQFGSPQTWPIEPMSSVNSAVVLANDVTALQAGLQTNDLAVISDCQVADIFSISNTNDTSIAHAASDNGGDNRLSAPYGQGPVSASPALSAQIMRFEANIYYVGDTGRTNGGNSKVYALYRQSLPYNAGNPPVEMVEGVANMKIRLGYRDALTGNDIIYVSPEASDTQAGRVEVVEIGLLMQSFDAVSTKTDTRTYELAGQRLSPAASGSSASAESNYITDKRMRLAFNTTINVRNRR